MTEWKVVAKTKEELQPIVVQTAKELVATDDEKMWVKCENREGFIESPIYSGFYGGAIAWCESEELGKTKILIHTHYGEHDKFYPLKFSLYDKIGGIRGEIPKMCVVGIEKKRVRIKCLKASEESLKEAHKKELELYLQKLKEYEMGGRAIDREVLEEIIRKVDPYREVRWEEL